MIKFVTVIPKHGAVACICMPNYTVAIINDEIYNSVRLLVYIIYTLSCRHGILWYSSSCTREVFISNWRGGTCLHLIIFYDERENPLSSRINGRNVLTSGKPTSTPRDREQMSPSELWKFPTPIRNAIAPATMYKRRRRNFLKPQRASPIMRHVIRK